MVYGCQIRHVYSLGTLLHSCLRRVDDVRKRNEDGSYKYAMGEIDGDLRQYTKEMNAALNGRGGGKPFFVQGSVQATEDEIRNFFEK